MVEQSISGELSRFAHGTISFEIKDEDQGVYAGQTLNGAILVNMSQEFEAKSIHVQLFGCEETSFTLTNEKGVKSKFAASYDIVNISFKVKDTNYDVQPAGQYWYPFEMIVPDWLPTSTMLYTDKDSAFFQVRYELRAYFEPVHTKDWAVNLSSATRVSLFRGQRSLFISQPVKEFPPLKLTAQLEDVIGGVWGMGSTKCTTQIIFSQNEFYTGNKATVRIICDNSQCDKPVKSFKFKLLKRYLGLNQE